MKKRNRNQNLKGNDHSDHLGPVGENVELNGSKEPLDQNLEDNDHSDHLGPVGENVELNGSKEPLDQNLEDNDHSDHCDNYHNDPTISPVTGRDFNLRKRERIDYNVGSTRKRPKHKHVSITET
nr:4817_t:CDS:2 [Entrophospora candida]